MLNAAGALQWFRDALAPGMSFDDLTAEAVASGRGCGGGPLPPVSPGRADPPRRPRRDRLVHRPLAPARPRRARTCGPRGSRLRAARLARAPARARCRAPGRTSVRRWRAQPPLARDRRVGARPSARALRRRRGLGVWCGAARRRGRWHVRRARARQSRRASVSARPSSRTLRGRRVTQTVTLAIGRCIRQFERSRRAHEARGQGRFRHGRESWHRSRGRTRPVEPRGSRSASRRAAETTSGSRTRSGSGATSATSEQVEDAVAQTVERFGRLDVCVANAGVGSYHTLVDTPARAPRGDDRRQPEGHDLRRARLDPAPDRERRGRPRQRRVGGRPPRAAGRGRLLRLEVRPGRPHARARPRAARARRPLHQRLPGRSRDGLRARGGLRPYAGRARGDDDAPTTWPRSSSSASRGPAAIASSRPPFGR